MRYFPSMWRIKKSSNLKHVTLTNNPIVTEIVPMATFSEESKPIALKFFDLKINERVSIGAFRMISLSSFQSKGSETVPSKEHLKLSPSIPTLIKIQICSFREGRVPVSRHLNTNITFPLFVNRDSKLRKNMRLYLDINPNY